MCFVNCSPARIGGICGSRELLTAFFFFGEGVSKSWGHRKLIQSVSAFLKQVIRYLLSEQQMN